MLPHMLRIHQSESVGAAKHYFQESLVKGDYYVGVETTGQWLGLGADRLGLKGEIARDDFHTLCANRVPGGTSRLTQRQSPTRRVGYDITFNASKSVSIMQGVVGDARIMGVFRQSVRSTMHLIERDAHVRVRKNGQMLDRKSGNLIWAEFIHLQSRPVDGIPDPALHAHCYTFNASYDSVEEQWKAGQFYYIKHDAPYYEAVFHSKLAEGLRGLGYQIQNQAFGFEIRGIDRKTIETYSRRTQEIEELATRLGLQGNAEAKATLAAKSRQNKSTALSAKQILTEWRARVSQEDLRPAFERIQATSTAQISVELALGQSFERRSVVQTRRIIATAIQNGLDGVTVKEIEEEFSKRDNLRTRKMGEFEFTTTQEVYEEELAIQEMLKRSRNQLSPIIASHSFPSEAKLDLYQRAAIQAVLNSKDRVVVVEGRAGTGKTTLMREAISAIQSTGLEVFTFAPTSEASHKVLKEEGFHNSATIQRLLIDDSMQREVRDAVLWVDEAGLLSTREMKQLVSLVEANHSRLVLSGDTKQHHSVERGDSLRLIANSGLVQVASTRRVFRQRRVDYRKAIELLADGQTGAAFHQLDLLDAYREIGDFGTRLSAISLDYIESSERFQSVLVVCPTHAEGRFITSAIRSGLRESGRLSGGELIQCLQNRNLLVSERQQIRHYRLGDIVKFHQNVDQRFTKGMTAEVLRITDDGCVVVGNEDLECLLPLELAKKFQLYQAQPLEVAKGEMLRLTENIRTVQGKNLYNGSIIKVRDIRDGMIRLSNGDRLQPGFEALDYGYVGTSHSSQGKTCDKVIVCQSGISLGASNLEQFYVSISRGRDEIVIYTDDKDHLLRHVRESDHRLLATEFLQGDSKRSIVESPQPAPGIFHQQQRQKRRSPSLLELERSR